MASGRRVRRKERMLGKRSRPVQKTPSKFHLMPDYPSDSSPTRDCPEDRHKFFNAPTIFIGFNPKGSSDSEGANSPTSPLDIKTFSGVGISHWHEKQVRSPRSGFDGSQCGSPRPWDKRDSEGIGLGILAALHNNSNNNSETNGGAISSSRGPLLGSQLKILVGSNQALFSAHNRLGSPKAQTQSPRAHVSSPHAHLYSQTQMSSLHAHLKSPYKHSDSPNAQLSSPQKQSEPISIGSPYGFAKPTSQTGMEHSESYTCVTSHGPESNTKHIYTHCGMESETVECPVRKHEQEIWNIASPPRSYVNVPVFPLADFLSACYLCKRQLSHGKDIYMYRGDKAFCSVECRYEQILMDEQMETFSPPSSFIASYGGKIFSTSTAAAA